MLRTCYRSNPPLAASCLRARRVRRAIIRRTGTEYPVLVPCVQPPALQLAPGLRFIGGLARSHVHQEAQDEGAHTIITTRPALLLSLLALGALGLVAFEGGADEATATEATVSPETTITRQR